MVRIISQNFLPPCKILTNRNGVDFIDQQSAERAVRAVALPEGRNSVCENNDTDTNDSFCDSDDQMVPQGPNGEGSSGESSDFPCDNQNLPDKKKERRRQRNKMSAQAYRQRRRKQSTAQQKILEKLEDQNKALLQKLKSLEDEKQFVEQCLKKYAKMPWNWPKSQCFTQYETIEGQSVGGATLLRPLAPTRMETEECATSWACAVQKTSRISVA